MTDITIKKITGPNTIRSIDSCGVVSCVTTRSIPNNTVITIDNFSSVEISLESPAGDFPIPETEDFGNIVLKAEGNRLLFNIAWTVKDEPTGSSIVSGPGAPTVTTVQEQLDYWINVFQPYSIEGKYLLKVDGIARRGYVRSIKFSKSANTPVTYDGSMEFIAGDVVAGE